ncbi:hypothetical protein PTSG_06618 [Salpingoeca rosetta]|uniref:3-beta hydroxysteroid dehydrogenase/isomerase domain-containing protein n=1 Tax=Salpingoeca rosetta (strain ATCC 50818 / BSB-021) TaxID=946362 RepID=F2UFI0_SALR5|nr:uncharacterized protein PTSG_06618 [Salpingoeca rosetta]EGD75548.1 hypothetical protein PTSG_06618 [Salpingoeca rosetta]|eukprot:XP_004992005.1 hypothetical protein PTSG_06618 [Salpingoeca rosetta]
MKQWRACVVGGCGYLGQRLVARLVAQGHGVVVADIAAPPADADPAVTYVKTDIRKYDDVAAAFQGCDVVFHTASIVDMSPAPTDMVAEINVDGTTNIIKAAQASPTVLALVYTSSMDVCVTGEPIRNGNEDLPYPTTFLNAYIETKGEAERRVLRADGQALRTCALRSAHIYGPGDMMITEITHRVARGQVPARFGSGINDYIFVENCVTAHIDCMTALCGGAISNQVRGRPFFINDFQAPMWEHMQPMLETVGLKPPSLSVPFALVYFLATINEFLCRVFYAITHISVHPNLTRYIMAAVAIDLYFDASRARQVFWHTAPIPRSTAMKLTCEWARTLTDAPYNTEYARRPQLQRMHAFHFFYGALLSLVGTLAFLDPQRFSHYFGVPCSALPSSGAFIAQTAGLIIAVLGSYSLCAAVLKWPMVYFQVTWAPKLVTAFFFAVLVLLGRLPAPFWLFVFVETWIGLITLVLSRPHVRLSYFFNGLTLTQGFHALASGIFAMIMTVCPLLALPNVIAMDASADKDDFNAAVAWGHVMGAAEFMMTWTYSASAFVDGMQRFAWLSVASRLSAVVVLWVAFALGHTSLQQAVGASPDGILAILSLLVLRNQQPPTYSPRK